MDAHRATLDVEDLRRMTRVRWDLDESHIAGAFQQGVENAGPVPVVEVWGCKPALVLLEIQNGATVQRTVTGVPETMLERAVFEAGGSLLMAGRYPVNEEIEQLARGGGEDGESG